MVVTNKDVNEFKFNGFSEKALDYLKNSNYFINIAEGAVRSGKTINCVFRFVLSVLEDRGTSYAIAGRTTETSHRNVVKPLLMILKSFNVDFEYVRGNREITTTYKGIKKVIYIFGADNSEAQHKLAGLTLQSILIDEASRCDKEFFEMALSRLSEPEAKAFITTNPDNYSHWLKTEYIDNERLKNEGILKSWIFYLEDNNTLSKSYIQSIKESYMGNPTKYARLIESKWVSSTGLIYSSFSMEDNVFDEIDLKKYNTIDIGCDYASASVNVFTVVGTYSGENGLSYHDILDEVVFDAQKEGYEQTDTDRCKDLLKLQEKYNLHHRSYVYVPHDATSLKSAIYQDKNLVIRAVKVKPETLEFIYTIQDLFYQNRIRVHKGCTETLRSINSYVWDEKKVERGEDYPDKTCYDHPCDSFRFPIIKRMRNRKPKERKMILNL